MSTSGTDIRKAITKCPLLITKNKELMKVCYVLTFTNKKLHQW